MGIINPNKIKIGMTNDKSHLLCSAVEYRYDTLP